MPEPALAVTLPLTPRAGEPGAGIRATLRTGLGIATVHARRGKTPLARTRIADACGIDPGDGPGWRGDAAIGFVGTAPHAWLAIATGQRHSLSRRLREVVDAAASVTEQSDALAVLRLRGAALREVLAKGVALDLHPAAFAVGHAAVTGIAHCRVHLWRLADDHGGGPVFEMAVGRSHAGSLMDWLADSSAALGLELDQGSV